MAEGLFRVYDKAGTAILEVNLGEGEQVSDPKTRKNEIGQVTRKGEAVGPVRVEVETFVQIEDKPKRGKAK